MIIQINQDIEKFRLEGIQQEQDHKASLGQVEEQQKEAESQALEYEAQVKDINKILDQIKTGRTYTDKHVILVTPNSFTF